jgi:hypothetical protein
MIRPPYIKNGKIAHAGFFPNAANTAPKYVAINAVAKTMVLILKRSIRPSL